MFNWSFISLSLTFLHLSLCFRSHKTTNEKRRKRVSEKKKKELRFRRMSVIFNSLSTFLLQKRERKKKTAKQNYFRAHCAICVSLWFISTRFFYFFYFCEWIKTQLKSIFEVSQMRVQLISLFSLARFSFFFVFFFFIVYDADCYCTQTPGSVCAFTLLFFLFSSFHRISFHVFDFTICFYLFFFARSHRFRHCSDPSEIDVCFTHASASHCTFRFFSNQRKKPFASFLFLLFVHCWYSSNGNTTSYDTIGMQLNDTIFFQAKNKVNQKWNDELVANCTHSKLNCFFLIPFHCISSWFVAGALFGVKSIDVPILLKCF